MANRVTVQEVKEIFSTTMEDDSISAFIGAANTLVNNTSALASPALDATTLKEIEKYVAAHFCCLRDPISLRVKVGESESWSWPASVTVAWSRGLGLTPYGQAALLLDTSGELSNLGQKRGSFRASPRENSSNFTSDLT